MNFGPFGQAPVQQFAKLGYEYGGGPVLTVAPDGKVRQDVVVQASAPHPASVTLTALPPIHTVNTGVKYQTISSSVNLGNISYGGQSYVQDTQKTEPRERREDIHHDLMATMMQQQVSTVPQTQQLLVVVHEPKESLSRHIKQEAGHERAQPAEFISIGDVTDAATWQTLTGAGVADYLSALPLPLHHLLKYAPADKREDAPTIVTAVNGNVIPVTAITQKYVPATTEKRDDAPTIVTAVNANVIPVSALTQVPANSVVVQTATIVNQTINTNSNVQNTIVLTAAKKKKTKKCKKDKKIRPRPGEIRLTTALDGSTLYCCPECHMAYPERGLLEQHLLGHTMERKFICDICNAALKRKDHLTRHKQSHNPERPHVCSVCLKAFKRKEQLTLHFVIHSGEKRHVCMECGKGFYRKDHLRKHTRSHIARRVKAELSQQSDDAPLSAAPVAAPDPEPS